MVAERVQQRVTPAEYLALERQAETKSEYIDGCIVAMSGGTANHSLIAMNVTIALGAQLRDGHCRIFSSDLRVGNATTGRYTYSDLSIVCGQPEYEDETRDILLNPTVIVEVLSPSTEAYDRGDKFAAYRQIPSLREYVLIAQDHLNVEHYLRQDKHWLYTPVADIDGSIALPTIGCTLPLREVYRLVEFPAEPAN